MPVIPRALQPGQAIAFLSPSERLNTVFEPALLRAKAVFEALGYPVKIFWTQGSSPRPTVTQSITHRIAELVAAFSDPEVGAIICTIGGSTATELLPTLLRDKVVLKTLVDNPKIFVGYSDITVIHWVLAAQTGLRTFYGPTVLPELGVAPAPAAFDMDNLLRTITPAGRTTPGALPQSTQYAPLQAPYFYGDPASMTPQALAPTPSRKWLRGGPPSTGHLFGGCLPVVARLHGIAGVAPDSWARKIMFLETAFAEGSRFTAGFLLSNIRRALADLAAAGIFEDIEGLVFGRCFGYDGTEQRAELERVIVEALAIGETGEKWGKRKEFPVLMHADFGHTDPMLTLPMGALARLDAERDEFAILEPTVV
ncbi:peptidase u61 ld-carboxypeptidase a [Mycena alexandri]|uniref:Peptidase u61 ld-carboxypeptidase a n=1 Tax=Mycena alexandri TaxID=1745969 RepID=A0AAD6ST62_9AGAR|nr:peptidase u61 ld-carboxypeptidase a [Mycena alexandri]